jgi:hypothetical protein
MPPLLYDDATSPATAQVIAKLRASFEQSGSYPHESSAYAERVHLSHNWEPGAWIERETLIAGLKKEEVALGQSFAGSFSQALTRFVSLRDLVVTTVVTSATTSAGEPVRLESAAFFRLRDGVIGDIQAWYCQKQAEIFLSTFRASGVWEGVLEI